ncbi:hypothetical protein [Methyloglobulus sp.]|uniref:hypothetical protein n=1 Tax=Methyloglobulus sp. TaxID=2518622 RepID=UPI0039899023
MKAIIALVLLVLFACTPITQMPKQGLNVGKQIAFSRDKGKAIAWLAMPLKTVNHPEILAQH